MRKPTGLKRSLVIAICATFALAPWTGFAQAPGIYRELFTGFTRDNNSLAQLTNDVRFRNNTPTSTNVFTASFQTEASLGEDYGQRLRAFLVPPATGNYTFWIASDEVSQLFLSTDENPANKRVICFVDPRVQPANYTTFSWQQSSNIALQAGQRYYIEALHKEANLIDHLSVQWRLPNGTMESPIPGSRFVYEIPPVLTVQLTNITVEEGRAATFQTDTANFLPQRIRWQRNGTDIAGATNKSHTIPVAALADNGALFRAFITNQFGATNTAEVTLSVWRDTNAPTITAVLPASQTNLFIVFSEAMQAASALNAQNYKVGGATVQAAEFGEDAKTVILTTSPLAFNFGSGVAISNLFDRASAPNALAPTNVGFTIVREFNPQDIGSSAIAGGVVPDSGRSIVSGAGSGIGGLSDQFQFGWQSYSGNFDFRVQVHSLDFTDLWARAGLMARESLSTTSRFAAAFATPNLAGSFFQYRATTGEFTTNAGSYPVSYPNTWLRLKRAGDLFTGFASMDGNNWTQLGNVTIAMSNRVYVGLAVTSQKTNQTTTATFSDFFVVTGGTIDAVAPTTEPLGPSSRKTGLVISEIMYHPRDTFAGTNKLELEFVELFNSNPFYEDISGYRLSGDIEYTFPSGTVLQGGTFLVVARAPADVQSFYGLSGVLGPFTNNLPNDAGRVRLRNSSGSVLLEVNYSSKYPWPVAADGAGHSLVLARPSYGEGQRAAWAASDAIGGSPGRLEPFGEERMRGVVINEFLAHTDDPQLDFIELHNHTRQTVNVAGAFLTDDPATNKFRIPNGTTIPPLGFLSFDQNQLGFSLKSSGDRIFLVNGIQTRVIDAIGFEAQANGVSSGRFPDGAPRIQELTARTPGASNAPPLTRDIVINEIMYNPISGNSDDEYLELFNKGTNAINLGGWRFTDGIDFRFPSNTVIAAGGYLVMAKNAANLFARYTNLNSTNTVGDYDGTLANRGERVALAKPELAINSDDPANITTNTIYIVVDELEFGTGGRWGQWSDGGGSSLELIDPRSDNRLAPNWADSDETAKAPWTTIETTGVVDNGNDDAPNALHVAMLEEGECLIDNVEVFAGTGGANLVSNGSFAANASGWIMRGNHQRSSWATNEGFGSATSLRVRASSRGDGGANKIRFDFASALTTGQPATIRAKVRWLRGWPEILFQLRGAWLEATDRMIVPTNLGTPGAQNSRARSNAGPAITDVSHSPAVPAANQTVLVTASVTDPDRVLSATLNYRVDPETNNTFAIQMTDDGSAGDVIAGDGIYSARVPGQPANTVVAFTILASDAATPTAVSRFPAVRDDNGPARECLIHFGGAVPVASFGTYRFWITQQSVTNWTQREVLSNERIDGTFVYGNQRVIYNAGGRYSGSPAHQDQAAPDYSPVGTPNNYAFDTPKDDLLLGTDNFNKIHGPGNNHHDDNTLVRETTAYWMARRLGLPECYKRHVIMFINGARRGSLMEDTLVPNGDYVESVFPDDADGDLFKISVWYEFAPATSQVLSTASSREGYLNNYATTGGAKKRSRYRWVWAGRAIHGTANDYSNLFTLVDAANAPAGSAYASTLNSIANVENWMRTFALEHAIGNWDSFGYRNEQNMFVYKPERGRWETLIWDINIIFGGGTRGQPVGVTDDLFEIDPADTGISAIYNTPQFRRAYWQALKEIAEGVLVNANVDPVMDARFNSFAASGVNVSSPDAIKTWITQRRTYMLAQLRLADPTNFTLATQSFSANSNLIAISGVAPFVVKTIEVNGAAWPITWTTVTNWTMRVPLAAGANQLSVVAYDAAGRAISGGSNSISVTFTSTNEPALGNIVINELMFHSAVPDGEYIELFNNSSNTTFNLSGWRVNGVDYTFPDGSFIAPRNFLVLAKNRGVFANTYGALIPVFGEFAGDFQSNGETVSLVQPGAGSGGSDLIIDRVRYEPSLPWPIGADGTGSSYQLVDARQDNARAGNWTARFTPGIFYPAVTNTGWQFRSITATTGSAAATRLLLSIDSIGDLYVDDIWLVDGTNAAVGANYVRNGDFESPLYEDPPLTNTWMVPTNYTNTAISSELVHSGNGSLHMICSLAGTALNRLIIQNLSPAPIVSQPYTLSFWFYSTNTTTNVLIRVQNTTLNMTVNVRPSVNPASNVPPIVSVSPGAVNPQATNLPAIPPLWINEVQPDNVTGIQDNNSQRDPWIELYNGGTTAASLDGLYLSSNYTNLTNWAFPSGRSIGAGQFMVIFCDAQPAQTTAAQLHTSFRLTGGAGSVALSRIQNGAAQVLDYVNYSGIRADRSYGSFPDGQPFDRLEFSFVTPGATNNGSSTPLVVFINEWMARNGTALADPADGDFDDWFELYNPGDAAVDLAGYSLTDDFKQKSKYLITTNGAHIVPARGYLLVWADEETGQNVSGGVPRPDLHVNFQLTVNGEEIGLFASDGTQIDAITYTNQLDDVSQGRFPDGSANIVSMPGSATPRAANRLGTPTGPRFSTPVLNGQNFVLTWGTTAGQRYQVEYKNDLGAPTWTPLGSEVPGTGASFSITNSITNLPQRFFRIRQL